MAKKPRRRNLTALWQGKVRKVIEQCSGPEVDVLRRLIWHRRMTSEQKYLILDSAIFDVWSEREADREEEAKERRKRAREQARQERELDARRDWERLDDTASLDPSSRLHGRPSSQPDIEHESASPEK
jgi:hypothetical protein